VSEVLFPSAADSAGRCPVAGVVPSPGRLARRGEVPGARVPEADGSGGARQGALPKATRPAVPSSSPPSAKASCAPARAFAAGRPQTHL
jgi:hypothetical protein